MSEKMDRRKARTRLLLRNALLELIEEKGLDEVTVTDITNRADINRGTFYLHYNDVVDMLGQLKEESFRQIRSLVSNLDFNEFAEHARKIEPYPKMVNLFEEVKRNADFFRVMFGQKGDLTYIAQFKELMSNNIYRKMTQWRPEHNELLVPIDFLIAYMTSANIGVLMHWLETGMKQSPHELGLILTRIVNYGPIVASGLISRPEQLST